eukprot:5350462-Prymnesium_polylepis.2
MENEPADGDFEALRSAMGGIYTISNKSDALEYDLDTLHEIAAYLQSQACHARACGHARHMIGHACHIRACVPY